MSKVALYQLYKYELHKRKDTKDMFPEEVPVDQIQRKFYELISGDDPLPVYRKGRKEEIKLQNNVEVKCEDVIVFMLCNEKAYTVTERKTTERYYEHPGCYIIIDNRESVAQMAIEQHSAFDGDTNKVCLLIEEAINKLLFRFGFEISIKAKTKQVEFWRMVEDHTKSGETIKRVSFRFSSPSDTAGIDAPKDILEHLEYIHNLQRAMGKNVGEMNFCASEAEGLRMEKTNRDLVEMVTLCQKNEYDLEVDFSGYGLYRSGTEAKARYALSAEIVVDFIEGVKTLDQDGRMNYELITWLDKSRIAYEDYDDSPVKPARKKGN